jgi:hypothetical protein
MLGDIVGGVVVDPDLVLAVQEELLGEGRRDRT